MRRLAQCGHRRQRVEAARGGVGAGRDAVVRQAVPGREFEHRQVRGDEGERLDDRGQALAVARDEEQRPVGRGLGYRRGEREGLKTVGDAVDDELAGSAFRQADFFEQAHKIILQVATAREAMIFFSRGGVESGRDGLFAGEPGQKVGVLKFEQMLILVQFGVGQGGDGSIGEAAEDQIHLADAAMPGAEEQLAPPRIQPFARSRRSAHQPACIHDRAAHIAWIGGRCQPCAAVACRLELTDMRPSLLDPLFAPITSLEGVGPKVAGADREGGAGRSRRPRGAGRRPAVRAAAFGDRPAQPAGHRAVRPKARSSRWRSGSTATSRRRAATARCPTASMRMTTPARSR